MPIPRLTLKECIATLKTMVLIDPPNIIDVMCAGYLMKSYDRELLPDWVEALANVNPHLLSDGLEEIRRMIVAETCTRGRKGSIK